LLALLRVDKRMCLQLPQGPRLVFEKGHPQQFW
jgi:hypothetical protein